MRIILKSAILIFALLSSLHAKDAAQVINWPSESNVVLKFTVSKISRMGSYGGHSTWSIDTSVQNLYTKPISRAQFLLYLFDKNKVRIGDGYIDLSNIRAGETVKVPVTAETAGAPASISVSAKELPADLQSFAPPKEVSLTVYSVPSEAKLTVDGKEAGVTPAAVHLNVGSHMVTFEKQGYSKGTFPLVVSPDQLSGGTITFELGTSAHDTIELRDGTVITGDLQSIDTRQVVIDIGGKPQTFERNQVKRVLLVQRENPS